MKFFLAQISIIRFCLSKGEKTIKVKFYKVLLEVLCLASEFHNLNYLETQRSYNRVGIRLENPKVSHI